MPKYKVTWRTESGTFEQSNFYVGDDPDPPGKWKVFYQFRFKESYLDYWTILPNRTGYVRRSEVWNRDLLGTAVGWQCKLHSLQRIETESRQPSLIALARGLEKSHAILGKRQPRRFIDITEG